MVKISANAWIWISPFHPRIIKKVKDLGFDGIEIPAENPAGMNVSRIREALQSYSLPSSSLHRSFDGRLTLQLRVGCACRRNNEADGHLSALRENRPLLKKC